MSDLVVTCPKDKWFEWIDEGDPAGSASTGTEWGWFMGGPKPPIERDDRLYVVAHGHLRGWAPVTRLAKKGRWWVICRKGGAVACTLPFRLVLERSTQVGVPANGLTRIDGFRGFRKVWWPREAEIPFPNWMFDGVPSQELRRYVRNVEVNPRRTPGPELRAELERRRPAGDPEDFHLEVT